MAEFADWLAAIRHSQDRMNAVVSGLAPDQASQRSYADDWSIAQVASHLGSQAEIFDLFLTAGLDGADMPDQDTFVAIWDRWNALPPAAQLADSVAANEKLYARLAGLTPEQAGAFSLDAFGGTYDITGLAGLRLGEHALHTWDMAVAVDPSALLAPDAVELLIDTLPNMAANAGTPVPSGGSVSVATTDPARSFSLVLDPAVQLSHSSDSADTDADTAAAAAVVTLPAEAFIRLVAGRLDPEHTPLGVDAGDHLETLRQAFPGF